MEQQADRTRRIVVVLDPMGPDTADLDLAILQPIVRQGIHELLGMLVEDVRLLAHARSRLATEVIFSGTARPLELDALEKQMRTRAAEARRHFESVAAQLGLPHVFRVTRGDVLVELTNMATSAEMLVIAVARGAVGPRAWTGAAMYQLARAPVPALLFLREGWHKGTTVLAVLEDLERAAHTLDRAARLAAATDSPLRVYLAGDALAHRADLVQNLSEQLAACGPIDLRNLSTRLTTSAVIHAVHGEDARLLVLAAPQDDAHTDLVRDLLDRTTCALMLVGRP